MEIDTYQQNTVSPALTSDNQQRAKIQRLMTSGMISDEHGLDIARRVYLPVSVTEDTIRIIRRTKEGF